MPEEKNWGAEESRQPKEQDGDTVLCSEHGRIIGRIDYRSHWFKLVKPKHGAHALLVSHGGGKERISLGHCTGESIARVVAGLDADSRYLLLHALLDINHDARTIARAETAMHYRRAFAEGRLKKRKMPGRDAYKITIEPEAAK